MKKILFILMAVFFLSSCDNVIDKTIDLFEDAAEDIEDAKSIEEVNLIDSNLDYELEKLEYESADEIEKLLEKAENGDEKVLKKLEKANAAEEYYRKVKRNKRNLLDR